MLVDTAQPCTDQDRDKAANKVKEAEHTAHPCGSVAPMLEPSCPNERTDPITLAPRKPGSANR